MRGVYVSLTTIPGRLHFLLKCLASLRAQTAWHRITQIIITIPRQFPRLGATIPDEDIAQLARLPKVVIHRPWCDLGPVWKYLPGNPFKLPVKAWLYVVDDDQEFMPGLLQSLLVHARAHPRATIVQNSNKHPRGYLSLLVRVRQVKNLRRFVKRIPQHLRYIDDDIVTHYLRLRGVKVHPCHQHTGARGLDPKREAKGHVVAALRRYGNRKAQQRQLDRWVRKHPFIHV